MNRFFALIISLVNGMAFSEPYWVNASYGATGPYPFTVQYVFGAAEYICRAGANGSLTPGNLSVGNRFCTFIDWGGRRSYAYEVLQDPYDELEWRDRNALLAVDRPFLGGWKPGRPELYICRPNHDRGGWRYAGSLEGSPLNGVCFIPDFAGRQDQTFDYEVLVYKL